MQSSIFDQPEEPVLHIGQVWFHGVRVGHRVTFSTDRNSEVFTVDAVSSFEPMVRIDGLWFYMDNLREAS
jgi:hypothetical protein